MAPTIVRDGQFRLFFFSREERRIHVHVAHPDGEAKFWLTPTVSLATQVGLSVRQLREAQAVVEAHLEEIQHAGSVISAPEVTHVSPHGFWLLVDDEELLVPFAQFPWFRSATIDQLTTIERPAAEHLYWPLLDIDLALASIRDPAAFPLVSRG
jgi:hypothetical protein